MALYFEKALHFACGSAHWKGGSGEVVKERLSETGGQVVAQGINRMWLITQVTN